MKQVLLILSFIVAAFLAACSDGANKVNTSKGTGSKKTIEQLDKASSDTSLEALKAQLELDPNTQIPDVINLVKSKFGTTTAKEQPKTETNEDDTKNLLQKPAAQKLADPKVTEQKEDEVPEEDTELLDLKTVDADCNPKIVEKYKEGSVETKRIYIKTCNLQVIVKRTLDNAGKVTAVRAYISAKFEKPNVEHIASINEDKTMESVVANYNATSGSMILKFNMKLKDKIDLNLETEAFSYGNGKNLSADFSDVNRLQSGLFKVKAIKDTNAIVLEFDRTDDVVTTKLNDEMGLFGKKEAKVVAKAGDAETVEQKLSPSSGVKSPTNPQGKKRVDIPATYNGY
ncbi:MAG: hypothetical protein V4596_11260 [Bdellovibrionota bacterium]